MDAQNELMDGLNRLVDSRKNTVTFPAKVTSVDASQMTIDVKDTEDIELFDVRLRASVDGSDLGFTLIPEVGSWVLVSNIGKSDNALFVVAFSTVSLAKFHAQGTQVVVEPEGVTIKRFDFDFKGVMLQLLSGLEVLTVNAAGAPSSPPINVATFTQLKATVNNIFK